MRTHYDFSKMKGWKNPYRKYLKQPVSMRIDRDTVAYFKSIAEKNGNPVSELNQPLPSRLCHAPPQTPPEMDIVKRSVMRKKLRLAIHPEENLQEEFIKPLNLSCL